MADMFEHGAFLDSLQIPIISNASTHVPLTTVESQVMQIWDATVINSIWNAESVFLYCYPMSEAEFTKKSGKYNSDLQAWVDQDDGYGCYLQGISDFSEVYVYGTPPGYKNLATSTYPFSIPDVIKGSYASFVQGGFNYTPSVEVNVDTVASLTAGDINDGNLWTMPGMWNLWICDPHSKWSIDEFYDNMNDEGYGWTARAVPKARR
ncbi:uncharacterized protein N7498_001541 [Penicillium cinerascens]|uniref:Uncharacterized protein n=1 Tax=Penicillium cinerascens TaxID=70096 RepID=A0A9W9NGD9_9EURO|nr:uncharacterized protein N7498_001541 [Penicillium cinerascens]KAJ5219442.1 hypothetical protein N7498_001541 [Penicillium cinerascens]